MSSCRPSDVPSPCPEPPSAHGSTPARQDAETIAELESVVRAQALLIREQAAALAHSRKIFERSSEAARIGVWECELATEALTWTDGVYDIFELPRGSAVDRNIALACYTPASAAALDVARSRAIEEHGGFTLDAEIVTARGRRRWIRLTATVECENGVAVRIFGMKQDITEEKLLGDRTRYLAEIDVMTGLCNRSRFQEALSAYDHGDATLGALLLVDLDGFKTINDSFGHTVGDECLKEVAVRLVEVCREAAPVFRIGGDEFAMFLGAPFDRPAAEALAGRIVDALDAPVENGGRALRLGASVGIAPAGGCSSSDLFIRADTALYAAKAAGRNTFRFFETGECMASDISSLDAAPRPSETGASSKMR